MKNEKLITDIEQIKQALTDAQKALEDNDLQNAGDNSVAAAMFLKTVNNEIAELFNKKK